MPKQDNTTAVVVNALEKEEAAAVAAAPTPAEGEPVEESPSLDDTAEIALESAEPEPAATEVSAEEEPEKSNTGMIIGIPAVVLITIAAGAFFMFGGKGNETSPPVVTVSKAEEEAEDVDTAEVEEDENEDDTENVPATIDEDDSSSVAVAVEPPPGRIDRIG
jgi:uncharacterized protein HemX